MGIPLKAVPKDAGKPAEGIPESYHQVADKVGLVPNLRWSDNLYQGMAAAAGAMAGGVAGVVLYRSLNGFFVGSLLGFIVGGILAGFALMVVGLLRK